MMRFTLYDGPSELDGEPIVCIVTTPHVDPRKSYKTQGTVQTYIIRSDVDPITALQAGHDASVCGDCALRGEKGLGRSCYVPVWGSVNNIWRAYRDGAYPHVFSYSDGAFPREWWRATIRLGAYGDPAAVPERIWSDALGYQEVFGYTHQWRDERFAYLKRWAMASCESEGERRQAQTLGWRTFRVMRSHELLGDREVICPASMRDVKCADCLACGGLSAKAKCDIGIYAHGNPGARNFERRTARVSHKSPLGIG